MNNIHSFRTLVNNKGIMKDRVMMYKPPKITTQKQFDDIVKQQLKQKRKIELKRVKI